MRQRDEYDKEYSLTHGSKLDTSTSNNLSPHIATLACHRSGEISHTPVYPAVTTLFTRTYLILHHVNFF